MATQKVAVINSPEDVDFSNRNLDCWIENPLPHAVTQAFMRQFSRRPPRHNEFV
jgi:hypothetical protein